MNNAGKANKEEENKLAIFEPGLDQKSEKVETMDKETVEILVEDRIATGG